MNRSTATLMDTSWREWTALNILVVTKDCKVDVEITARIQTASCAIGRLRERVFDCRNLIVEIKLIVYIQCVIHLMIDDSETWTLYRYHISSSEPSTKNIWDIFLTSDEITSSQTMRCWILLIPQMLRSLWSQIDCLGWAMFSHARWTVNKGTSLWRREF